METNRDQLKSMVRGAYALQKLRIQMGNRVVANYKVKLGQDPGESEKVLDKEGKKILLQIRASHKKFTDGMKTFPRSKSFKGDGIISNYTELCLVDQYETLEEMEKRHFGRLKNILEDFAIWRYFLKGVKGVGPAMGGVLLSEIDISRAKYPSSLWAYAGLDVAEDGKGRSRRKEHLVEVEYKNSKGEADTRKSITFNPFLKTKLIGVLAASFVMQGENTYEQIYRAYKNRLENNPAHDEKSKGHRDNMAKRYMIKQFLVDLHQEWRGIEGFPVATPYSEGKLGLVHAK